MRRCAGILIGLLLAACGGSGPPGAGGVLSAADVAAHIASGHLHRQLTQYAATIDPTLSEDLAAYSIIDDLFEGLVRLDPEGQIVPGVATHWEVSADGLTWRFHLRSEARWSNDEPVTAADFVYAWRRAVDPVTAAVNATQLEPIAGAGSIIRGDAAVDTLGVRAIDARTLEVRLKAPTPYFLYLLTNSWLMPLHAATLSLHGARWTDAGKLVGNGAFLLQSRSINGPTELRRNPRYREAATVRLQAVTWHPLIDTAAATARFLAGDLDITDRFQLDDADWLAALPGHQLRLEPYFGSFMLGMHTGRPPFDDVRLRRALLLAIDREVLESRLWKGRLSAAYGIVPPMPGYEPHRPEWASADAQARHHEAQRLYAEAGYSRQKPLQAELWYPSTDADTRRTLEGVVAMWRTNLGAMVRLSNEEWTVHKQNRQLRRHGLFFYTWIGDYLDPLTFLALPLPGSGQNFMEYHSAAYAQVLGEASATVDEGARYAAYHHAERILDADAPVIPLYHYRSRHLVRSYVQGWQANPMDRHASRDLYLAAPGGG